MRLNKNSKKEFPSAKVGYICDFCNEIKFDKEIMEAHLVENAHSSASKYLIESSDSNKNYKLCAILSRASLKNNGTKHVEKNSVFCPKCKIYFEDVLTCGKFSRTLIHAIKCYKKLIIISTIRYSFQNKSFSI